MSYRFADSLWAGAYAPAHKLSANLYDIHHCCVYNKKTPDDGREEMSETYRVSFQYSWFYYKKFITMHGHMNVKHLICVLCHRFSVWCFVTLCREPYLLLVSPQWVLMDSVTHITIRSGLVFTLSAIVCCRLERTTQKYRIFIFHLTKMA